MANSWPTQQRAQRGFFTLLELLYVAGYLGVGLAGLASLQMIAGHISEPLSDLSLATNVTVASLESYRATPTQAVLVSEQPLLTHYDRDGVLNGQPAYFTVQTRAVPHQASLANAEFFEVTVETSWKLHPEDDFVHSVRMKTRLRLDSTSQVQQP